MSTTIAEIVNVDYVKPHPDADRLDVAIIKGTTIVVQRGAFQKGQQAVFFPPDILIPERLAEQLGVKKWLKASVYPGDFIKSNCRVAACRLRGQPSYGFIVPMSEIFGHPDDYPPVGTDISAYVQAVKYEPPVKFRPGDAAPPHPQFHKYTDIENLYRYPDAFKDGTPVRITEKIHGSNSRVGLVNLGDCFDFMAGSHNVNRKRPENGPSLYWEPLESLGMMSLLTHLCDEQHTVVVFGEIYGLQDMDYGIERGTRGYAVFDISVDGRYLDWDSIEELCGMFGVPTVPLLYKGPYSRAIVDELTHGRTTVGDPKCDFKGREGVVITPLTETFYAPTGGRLILKSVSADYLNRNNATDDGELPDNIDAPEEMSLPLGESNDD